MPQKVLPATEAMQELQAKLQIAEARQAAVDRKELLVSYVRGTREAVRDGNKVKALAQLDCILIMLNARP
jgi:hypothetical protein